MGGVKARVLMDKNPAYVNPALRRHLLQVRGGGSMRGFRVWDKVGPKITGPQPNLTCASAFSAAPHGHGAQPGQQAQGGLGVPAGVPHRIGTPPHHALRVAHSEGESDVEEKVICVDCGHTIPPLISSMRSYLDPKLDPPPLSSPCLNAHPFHALPTLLGSCGPAARGARWRGRRWWCGWRDDASRWGRLRHADRRGRRRRGGRQG